MRKSTFALLAILGLLMAVPGFASQEIFGDPIILKDYWDGANRIYAEDLDGDGDIDILATALYEDDITWFENDGSPSFREHTIRGSFDGATRAYAADVDGDGRIDVVGSAANGQLVTWWKNNPSGNDPPSDPIEWTEHTIDGNFPQAMYVHAAYLNGDDTRMDVLAVRGGSYGDVHWWQNAASGNPAPADPVAWTERSISDDFDGANCVYAADVDGDGYTDVIASRHLAQTITWWENSPSGNPPPGDPITWTEHPIGSSLDNPSSVYAADVDLDGHTDILATTIYNDVLWWENHPSGAPAPADPVSWTQHTITDDFYGASSVYAVDMDLDGDTDIVAAASGGGQVAWWEAKPSGNVPPGDPFTWTKHLVHYDDRKPYGVYAADLDNDDDPDIVATVHHGGYVAWWENRTHDPPAGRIAFVSQRDGNFRIYTMDSHGGDQERLTMGQWDWSPSWSPDGSEIYFYSGHGQAQIFKIDINEVDPIPTPVTDDPAFIDAEPACSRDGERLVFQSERDGNMEIYVKDLALGAEQRMTDNPADDGWAAWSPDGSRIVFTSNREGNQDIFIMDYDPDLEDPTQLQPENLTRHPATDMSAAWAPDGTRIAFASTRDGNHEIYSMDLETRVVTRLTCNSRYDGAPAWSPDGKWIAFQTEESGARGIYIMRPTECIPGDRKYERQLTLNLDYAPDWWALPPDGTPPTTIIDVDGTLGDNAWFVSPVEVTLSATDDTGGSGVALTWYSVDGGPWIPYVQPFTIEGEGATTILAYSQDNAGNPEDPPVSEEVRIDFTPPATTIDVDGTLGDNDWFVSPVEVTLSATDDTGGSGVDLTWYSLDGGPWIPYVEPFTIEGEGATTVLAYSQDNAGNPEGPPASEDVNVDYTPPTIAASRSPAPNSNGWNNGDVTAHFDCYDAVSGIAACTSDTVVTTQGKGQSVTGTARDMAGNPASTIVDDINIDKTDPTVNITEVYPNPASVSESADLVADLADERSGIQAAHWCAESESLACTWEAMTLTGVAGDLYRTASASLSGLSPGVYSVKVKTQDLAENESDVAQAFLVVYDPSAGFATGGGWIIPGTEPGDFLPGITGEDKANFGFVVKYKKGATTPDGQLEFHYRVGDFNLHSTEMHWMAVNSNWAKFQGDATINLHPDQLFYFRVDARDGNLNGGSQKDRFIIKVWGDYQDPDADDPIYRASGDLMGGNIIIHTK